MNSHIHLTEFGPSKKIEDAQRVASAARREPTQATSQEIPWKGCYRPVRCKPLLDGVRWSTLVPDKLNISVHLLLGLSYEVD